MEYNDKLCAEIHKRIDERDDTQDRRLNNHAERIDNLEKYQSRSEEKVLSLCEQIRNLVSTIRVFMVLMGTTLLGFFIWYVQGLGGAK